MKNTLFDLSSIEKEKENDNMLKYDEEIAMQTEELGTTLKTYAEYHKQEKLFAELMKPLNKRVKELMEESGLNEFEYDGVSAKYIETARRKYDEDLLIKLIEEAGVPGILETKVVVNKKALEKAIETGEIEAELVAEAQETVYGSQLRIKYD